MRKTIEASKGHILTDGKVYGRKIYLADGEDETRYYEITKEEYDILTSSNDDTVF